VSQAGNHDNRNYEDDWGERSRACSSMNGRHDNYDVAGEPDLVAHNLRGKLLLAHGVMDTTCRPYNTYLVVDALIKAEQGLRPDHLPARHRHGFGAANNYMMRRRWDYFVRHLHGRGAAEGVRRSAGSTLNWKRRPSSSWPLLVITTW
jgi:dipeptidyl-peptidase 4